MFGVVAQEAGLPAQPLGGSWARRRCACCVRPWCWPTRWPSSWAGTGSCAGSHAPAAHPAGRALRGCRSGSRRPTCARCGTFFCSTWALSLEVCALARVMKIAPSAHEGGHEVVDELSAVVRIQPDHRVRQAIGDLLDCGDDPGVGPRWRCSRSSRGRHRSWSGCRRAPSHPSR